MNKYFLVQNTFFLSNSLKIYCIELKKRLVLADIPPDQIGRIERPEINTTLSTTRAISKALYIHITDLIQFPRNKLTSYSKSI